MKKSRCFDDYMNSDVSDKSIEEKARIDILDRFSGSSYSSSAIKVLDQLAQRYQNTNPQIYTLAINFVSSIAAHSSPDVTFYALNFAFLHPEGIKPEYSLLPGLYTREGLNTSTASDIPRALLIARLNSGSTSAPLQSQKAAANLIQIVSDYDVSTSSCIIEKAFIAAELGNTALEEFTAIMNDEDVKRGILQKPLYDLQKFMYHAHLALSNENDTGPTINEAWIKDPSTMEFTQRMATFYNEKNVAKVMHAILNQIDLGVNGAERIATASCLAEVAARTYDRGAVLEIMQVACCYQLSELESIMKAIERHVKRWASEIAVGIEHPYIRNLTLEQRTLSKSVYILKDAFINEEVRKIGHAVRQRPAEKVVGNFPLLGTDDLLYTQVSMEEENSSSMAENIIEVAIRTGGARNAIEAVAKTMIADDSYYENKTRIIMQAVRSNDVSAVESFADIINNIDTSLVGYQEEGPSNAEKGITAALDGISLMTTNASILIKATEIAKNLAHEPLAIQIYQNVVNAFSNDPNLVIHIGNHIIESEGDQYRLRMLFGSLLDFNNR